MEKETIRINKFLSQYGICSRREADRMAEEGRICINGQRAEKGSMVEPEDVVTVDGRLVERKQKEIILAFHKPAGVVCTSSKKEADNIIDYLKFPERIYPVGRLDKDSTGLILLTNNGQLMEDILRGRNGHEKEYIVTLDRPMKPEIYAAMEQGVPILDTMTKPCRISHRQGTQFHITLTQGLNRQIRRMCEYFGYRVRTLKRIRVMNIMLGDLPEGKWRYLTEGEITRLKQECRKRNLEGDRNGAAGS
ncbi:MAG: pseudouridine synthase [Lachnospiraceae bacterium]|nr:pseudouridine synthase [Lachnospiraceae bacterium]